MEDKVKKPPTNFLFALEPKASMIPKKFETVDVMMWKKFQMMK